MQEVYCTLKWPTTILRSGPESNKVLAVRGLV